MPSVSTSVILSHPLVSAVREAVLSVGGEAWLVGGAVRDWLRTSQLSADLDFTLVNCKAEAIAVKIVDSFQAHLVPLDPVFGIHRLVMAADSAYADMQIDMADALGNTLTQDLARRDLTVNAMAVSLDKGEFIDPHHGKDDLIASRVKMLSKENLLDDPLRLLRVFRIAASIQAEHWDEETLTVVRDHGQEIWKVAPERIQYELFRLLSEECCFPYLKQMADCGLLEVLIPDLTPMKTIGASGFHHLGLFDHTLELVKQAERLLPECPLETQEWLRQPFNATVTRLGLVKLGSLLHDIGKPTTMGTRLDPEHGTRLTFYRHEEVGEEMAEPWLRRMKVGNDVREHVKKLIRWHLYPCQFGSDSPRKSVLRYYRRMGDTTLDVTMLALADRHSSCGEWLTADVLEKSHKAHLWLMANYAEESKVLSLPRLLTGHDIMRILELSPGPELKKWLDILEEMQQLGEISTAEEAERWLAQQKG